MHRLLVALLIVCGTSFAGEREGVDVFLADFYADFSGRKIERLGGYFHPGAQAVFGGHVTVLAREDDVKKMFSAILGGLEKRGYHRSVVLNVSKVRLGENYVFASVLLDRVKADGKKIDTVCSAYSLVKAKKGWQILAWIPTEPLPDGRCAVPATAS